MSFSSSRTLAVLLAVLTDFATDSAPARPRWGQATGAALAEVPEWADARLTERDGLILWLDAVAIESSRKVNGLPGLSDGDRADTWQDSSGAEQSPVQELRDAQPKVINVGDAWIVRFDGVDDHLRMVSKPTMTGSATVILVAAPHANPGDFRGLFAANAADRRDYESGLTIDLGPGPTSKFDQLNVEGRGFGGANDVLNSSSPFGTLHTFEAVVDPLSKQVRLTLDGVSEGSRPYEPSELSLEQLTIGGRYYTNGPGVQQVRGPFQGDIAELLVYDRVLSQAETESVRDYLKTKYATLAVELPKSLDLDRSAGEPLVLAENPPAVQMLVPGFTVTEIPVELTNVNNVRFRDDGKLMTLGYNGDLHLLSDTNGDGLEDKSDVFWNNEGSIRGPIGLLLTPPGYSRGRGAFMPSKGKVSLILDTNGDDKADEEIVVAKGWNEIPQNVDAVGMAMDKDGNLYFGLGTANYANAYLVDDNGISAFDLNSDRGTVQKVSADFSTRETVCTGIRFPIAFAFNEHGDLFCSEQEGATWLPNGNPLDELLHIQPRRHYGFPPRHPRHLPGVIDEPSTFDYGPQHQSTCGMVFNQSVNGGPTFGPAAWLGDALMCGESRGKIWRTKLVKTDAGYVAASQLIAGLQMLTVDACVAPDGDLVVACHSGPPDWGTGPAGIGKLFRIKMSEPEVPRPVMTWAEGPQEIRIAYDRPLDPLSLSHLAERIRVEYGSHVRAGDRFETLKPPYAVVQAQSLLPRFSLPVTGATVTSDLRTLIISTAPMLSNVHYAATIDSEEARHLQDAGLLAQHPQTDVDFALTGVATEWTPTGAAAPSWTGWLPHPDLAVSRALLAESAGHDALWTGLQTRGVLKLTTRLNLHNSLRPLVQPGASIDYEWPPENVSLMLRCSHSLVTQAVTGVGAGSAEIPVICGDAADGRQTALFTTSGDSRAPVDLTLTIYTDGVSMPSLAATFSTNEDASQRPLPLNRFFMPWVPSKFAEPSEITAPARIAELDGGSWSRGRKVFRSEVAGCFKCHGVGGGKATIGPDLMNLIHRDYASVMRDVANPSYAINPDYIGHTVVLKDGRVLTGVLQSEGEDLLLGDEKATVTRLSKTDIDTLKPSATSVMPAGVAQKLTADQMKDLLTYLLIKPPQMPLDAPLTAPPLRTQAEVAAALAGAPEIPAPSRPLTIVLVDGPKDHGPGEHDYPAWKLAWEELLSAADNVSVSTASEFPNDEQLAAADVLLFFQKGSFDGPRPEKLDAYLKRGGGAVYIHWAVNGNDQVQEFSKRIGHASWGGRIAFRHGPLTLDIHNHDHPIVRNFAQLNLYDESYWKLTGDPADVTLLATSTEENMPTPQLWIRDHNPGRVFVSIPGHYSWTFDDPLFRIILLRGIAWTAKEPVDRFNDLVPIGARMSR